MNEKIWRKAEANQAMRERRRLIEIGRIKLTSFPSILIKTDEGVWKFPLVGEVQ